MTMVGFEFPLGLKNSATTFQAIVRKPTTTNLIDNPARPQIGTPLSTTWSSSNHEFINTSSKYLTIDILAMFNVAPLHQVALHLNPNFSTVWLQGRTYGTDWGSHSRTDARGAIDQQCTTTSEGTYSGLISRAQLAWMEQHDIFAPGRYAFQFRTLTFHSRPEERL
jgi:hypothetical protein